MSAFEEFSRERRTIDSLLADGYTIVGTSEALEGMEVRFKKRAPDTNADSEPGIATLLLLTADARKYLSNLVFSQQQQKQA